MYDELDLKLAEEFGEKVGRNRTAKWVRFLLTYKAQKEVEELLNKLISRDGSSDGRLAKLERY